MFLWKSGKKLWIMIKTIRSKQPVIMKNIVLAIVFLCFATLAHSQSQSDINLEAFNNFKKADSDLNTTYQKILKEYKSDVVFLKNLKTSQKIWITFRDAEMLTKYPKRSVGYYGSIQPTCWNNYMELLTKERTKTLQVWLTGIQEGNMCSGTVKIKS